MYKTMLDLITKERTRTAARLAALDQVLVAYGNASNTGEPHTEAWKENISRGVKRVNTAADGPRRRRPAVSLVNRKLEIERILGQVDEITLPDATRILGCSETGVRKALEALESDGVLTRSERRVGPNGSYAYRLTGRAPRRNEAQVGLNES